jgi:transposase
VVAAQAAVIVELRAVNAEQALVIETLTVRVAELERQLARHSGNSSKPPSSDGLAKPPTPRRERRGGAGGRKPGKQPGTPGAHLAQVGDPDEVVVHRPVACQGCGGDLTLAPVTGVEARQVFDLPEVRLRTTEHRAERRLCGCGCVTAAAFPDQARSAACYGPGVRALAVYLGVGQYLPVERAAELLAHALGASVSAGWLAGLAAEGAAGLEGFAQTVREQLQVASVAHFDETGARVAGRLHWVHSASTALLSWFTVHPRRGVVAMDAAGVLPGFTGVAVHDGWSPYWRYDTATHALCAAHLLRELDEAAAQPGQGWAAELAEWLSVAPRRQRPRRRAPSGPTAPSWIGCWAATTRSSPLGAPSTRPRRAHPANGIGASGRHPHACWNGWTPAATRSAGSSTTCESHPQITRPNVTFGWSSSPRRSSGAGAPWTAHRHSSPCAPTSRPHASTALTLWRPCANCSRATPGYPPHRPLNSYAET